MFKPKYILEVKGQDERSYRFECDTSAPLGEMHDALFTMKGVVLEQLQKKHESEKPKEKCKENCEVKDDSKS